MTLVYSILSFIIGVVFAALVSYIIYARKLSKTREELIKLRAKFDNTESVQDMIKRDFVQLANETIRNEQEDLRRQNREVLEEKILPLTKELGEFKAKVEKFNISGLADSFPDELSGGELRRALIARALINHPEIIIADEPVSDLDINSAYEVMKIFADLNSEGVTLLMVSHDLDTLKYGNKIYTMSGGNLLSGNKL